EEARTGRVVLGSLSATALADEVLAPLDAEPEGRREMLFETLEAWLDEQGSPTAVGRRLRLHVQSARYRIDQLREVLGDAMPVDTIEIGADEEGRTSELGFGKYLSRNLFFRYVHILGDEPSDQVSLEYRLNDSFSVGSSVSTTGDAGLDLIFRRDF
ncbi:MAG TPA: translocation/assembly module TamB domain-containing protein, partial [Myxococcota bacterium]|nr:translocation/assembly module TamB domain-containing protein [Myxococcota bacterium]